MEQHRNAKEQPHQQEAHAVRTGSPGPNEQGKPSTDPGESEARENDSPGEMPPRQQWIRGAIVDEPGEEEDAQMQDRRTD